MLQNFIMKFSSLMSSPRRLASSISSLDSWSWSARITYSHGGVVGDHLYDRDESVDLCHLMLNLGPVL